MKKILLGTSALCAVAAFDAGPARADDANQPIKLGMGGFYRFGYGDTVSSTGLQQRGKRKDDTINGGRINFQGNTKLDNGLEVGVRIALNATNSRGSANDTETGPNGFINGIAQNGDYLVENYVKFVGAFGEVRAGDINNAERQTDFTAPEVGDLFGANTPYLHLFPIADNGINTNTSQNWVSQTKRPTGMVYFTPQFAGFSAAVSYAPGGEKGGMASPLSTSCTQGFSVTKVKLANAFGNGTVSQADCPRFMNIVSASANYDGKVGPVAVQAYVAASQSERGTTPGHLNGESSKNNPMTYGGGLIVGFAGFKVGAVEQVTRDKVQPGILDGIIGCAPAVGSGGAFTRCQRAEADVTNAGISWESGPFGVALDWTQGRYNGYEGNASPILHTVVLGTNYILGPGIAIGAGLSYNHWNSHVINVNPPAGSSDVVSANGDTAQTGLVFFLGTAVNF